MRTTYVNGEVDGLVADGLADLLDDAVSACRQSVVSTAHGARLVCGNVAGSPMVSISRASILWNPDSSSLT